ncbi:MAG: outer membrane lipoprotein carrier protein LolA [Mollicutes bacterium]|nr:outer membrane lipoprotein carrier protein LolA [Mollicutes bacterium]
MKRKVQLFLVIIFGLLIVGCGNNNEKDVIKNLTKKIEESKGYHLVGELEMLNNDDVYKYEVDVSYEYEDKFRVSLKNKINNHEQIILKNEDGVYVLTPSLNKSFKFQSEWPYNNSQSYLLQTLLLDIKNDKEREFAANDNGYVITTNVNYTSNKNLVKQNIYLDKDINIKEVHVLDKDNKVMIKMKFNEIDLKATHSKNLFALKNNMETAVIEEEVEVVSKIQDVIYPMYMPENTKLTNQDRITKENGERIISTFSGDKSFILVQETAVREEEMVTIPVIGEPLILTGTVAAFSDSSITWTRDGIDYYLIAEGMDEEEMVNIAKSISVMPVGK